MGKVGHWLTYRRGKRRLRHGYCPQCYSSPPLLDCWVCKGSREYGPLHKHDTHIGMWALAWERRYRFLSHL